MPDVTIEKSGLIRYGAGAIVLYGPFTDAERESLTRRIVASLRPTRDEAIDAAPRRISGACVRSNHTSCGGYYGGPDNQRAGRCSCKCHEASS